VEKNKGQSDAAVAVGLLSDVYKRYYAPDWYGVEAVSELNHLETTHRIVWVAYTLPVHLRAWYPEVWRTLEEDYDVVKVLQGTLGDGDIVICRSKREEAE
jgi:uncharacterized NAD-dependent epimerase/dehydratase family protein